MRIGLFAMAVLGLVLLSNVRAAAPSNDNLVNAIELAGTNVTVRGTNIDATKEIGEPAHAGNTGGRSVWWRWTAPAAGSVLLETTGSSFDTLLAVYTGASYALLNRETSNDDYGSAISSAVAFNVSRGVTYRIAVDGFSGASGDIQLALSYRPSTIQPQPNDSFADRIPLTGANVETRGANFFATKEKGEPSHAGELGGASVWWSWTAPFGGQVEVLTEGSTFDTLLGVYTGSVLTNLTLIAKSDDVATNQPSSRLTFTADAGENYAIAVDGFAAAVGEVKLTLRMQDLLRLDAPELLAGAGIKVRLIAPPGSQYTLEASNDLVAWEALETLTSEDGTIEFTDPSKAERRFFRARQAATGEIEPLAFGVR